MRNMTDQYRLEIEGLQKKLKEQDSTIAAKTAQVDILESRIRGAEELLDKMSQAHYGKVVETLELRRLVCELRKQLKESRGEG